jgi:hypothetical protein
VYIFRVVAANDIEGTPDSLKVAAQRGTTAAVFFSVRPAGTDKTAASTLNLTSTDPGRGKKLVLIPTEAWMQKFVECMIQLVVEEPAAVVD